MNYSRKIVDDTIFIVDENGKNVISIRESADADKMYFILDGELLNKIAYELEDELIAGLSVRGHIVVDMIGLSYIASSGLRSLLKIQNMVDEKTSYEMTLRNISDEIKQIFTRNGFLDLFSIEK